MRRAYSAIVTDVVFSAIAAILLLLSGLAGRPINYSWAEGHTGVTVGLYPLNVQLRWSLSRFCIGNDCEFIDSFPYTSDQEGICYPSPSREHVTAMFALNAFAVLLAGVKLALSFCRLFDVHCLADRWPSFIMSNLAFACAAISTAWFTACKETLNKDVYDLEYGFGWIAAVLGTVALVPTLCVSSFVPRVAIAAAAAAAAPAAAAPAQKEWPAAAKPMQKGWPASAHPAEPPHRTKRREQAKPHNLAPQQDAAGLVRV